MQRIPAELSGYDAAADAVEESVVGSQAVEEGVEPSPIQQLRQQLVKLPA